MCHVSLRIMCVVLLLDEVAYILSSEHCAKHKSLMGTSNPELELHLCP